MNFLSLVVCVIGLLMYALSGDGRLVHIGDTMFWTGLLATLLSFGGFSFWWKPKA